MEKRKICFGTIIFFMFFLLTEGVFAQSQLKESVSPAAKGYTCSLQKLIEQARKNIKKVDIELKKQKEAELNREREATAREHFERGNLLYSQGKLEEAKQEWKEALAITQLSEMKEYIKSNEKRARQEEIARQKEKKAKRRRLEEARVRERRKLEVQAKGLYEEAKKLYGAEKFKEAISAFEEVIAMGEDLKYACYAEKYIKRCRYAMEKKEIALEKARQKEWERKKKEEEKKQAELRKQKIREEKEKAALEKRRQREAEKRRREEEKLADALEKKRQKEMERKNKEERKRRERLIKAARLEQEERVNSQKEAERQKAEKIKSLYNYAKSLYKDEKYKQAIISFEVVIQEASGFSDKFVKDADKYIQKARNKMKKL